MGAPHRTEAGTSRATIEQWFREGHDQSYSYMIVACDQFDYGDYPVYTQTPMVEHIVEELFEQDLTDVHEVYDLDMDMDDQLNEMRAWHLPDGSEPPPKKGLTLSCGHDLTPEILKTFNEAAPLIFRCPEHGIVTFKQT